MAKNRKSTANTLTEITSGTKILRTYSDKSAPKKDFFQSELYYTR